MKTVDFKKLNDRQKKELYKQEYLRQKNASKFFAIKLYYSSNYHIIHKLEEQEKISQYIKSLIEKDITAEEKARYDKMQEQDLARIREERKNK